MERIEYRYPAGKAAWGPGPWQDEPDKVQWADEATGLPCLIVRGPSGALCGYAGVPEGHPWHGRDYADCEAWGEDRPDVHGGLTYSAFCAEGPEDRAVCHVPAPGDPDRVWWLGFDCAHLGDLTPAYAAAGHLLGTRLVLSPGEDYRPLAYVAAECARLAAQAAGASA